jgi:hypothetical protein
MTSYTQEQKINLVAMAICDKLSESCQEHMLSPGEGISILMVAMGMICAAYGPDARFSWHAITCPSSKELFIAVHEAARLAIEEEGN